MHKSNSITSSTAISCIPPFLAKLSTWKNKNNYIKHDENWCFNSFKNLDRWLHVTIFVLEESCQTHETMCTPVYDGCTRSKRFVFFLCTINYTWKLKPINWYRLQVFQQHLYVPFEAKWKSFTNDILYYYYQEARLWKMKFHHWHSSVTGFVKSTVKIYLTKEWAGSSLIKRRYKHNDIW